MLKQRVITAAILGSLIVFAIFKFPNTLVAAVFAGITLVGAWEWSTLIGVKTLIKKLLYVVLVGGLILVIWFFAGANQENSILLAASLWWLGVACLLTLYKSKWLQSIRLQWLLEYSAIIVLVPAWLALTMLHAQNPAMLMFLLALIWVADIAAYFTGKQFGKNKLAPELSPGKSREGVLGALVASVIMAFIAVRLFAVDKQEWVYFVFLCVAIALISVVGDLYESLLKRKAGAKDSGTILPGHGGVLDRIDSLTAAAPGYVFGLSWLCIGC
ncbi:MAG: phosphatidate cytidylyltransferase [Gammaproteobacteria bacterium]|nr:MAG: phosphatidate cytidylyltransferase [Gammaproteobacteria bacterium]